MTQSLHQSPEMRVDLREDGVVRVVVVGVTQPEQVEKIARVMFDIYRRHAPVLALLEVRHLNEVSLAARWKLSTALKAQRSFIRRSAVVGVPSHLAFMAQVVVKVSGRKNIRFFDDEAAATRWLLS